MYTGPILEIGPVQALFLNVTLRSFQGQGAILPAIRVDAFDQQPDGEGNFSKGDIHSYRICIDLSSVG
ncbi:MAG: hypothetical protein KDI07_19605 [Anaerolineae bacterium]|nr:hypothetical protein [Anaerolineae bacterium]MCO5244162.1 hypothetical protein [Anaerolineae bacterium]